MDAYGDRGFIVISAWSQNNSGEAPSGSEIEEWVELHGMENVPTVVDSGDVIYSRWPTGYIPTVALLEPGMIVNYYGNSIDESAIESVLPY